MSTTHRREKKPKQRLQLSPLPNKRRHGQTRSRQTCHKCHNPRLLPQSCKRNSTFHLTGPTRRGTTRTRPGLTRNTAQQTIRTRLHGPGLRNLLPGSEPGPRNYLPGSEPGPRNYLPGKLTRHPGPRNSRSRSIRPVVTVWLYLHLPPQGSWIQMRCFRGTVTRRYMVKITGVLGWFLIWRVSRAWGVRLLKRSVLIVDSHVRIIIVGVV
jgi:hypothetical protein